MDEILNALLQAIEENAFPLFSADTEYRQIRYFIEQQVQWLDEHLNDEEKAHLETLRQADLRLLSLECEAQVKLALAAGVHLALPG